MPVLLDLFCGTKSISREFESQGWSAISVDMDPKTNPTICKNILEVTPQDILAHGRPDLVWASPLCTHYSTARTTAKTPRDLEGSDLLVQKAIELASHFGASILIENPHSGLLKTREVIKHLTMQVIDYCSYADDQFPGRYRKRTAIFTDSDWVPQRALCNPRTCHFCTNGRHQHHAQRGWGPRQIPQQLNQLYSIPEALPRELCEFFTPV